jgi:hypothetical protein
MRRRSAATVAALALLACSREPSAPAPPSPAAAEPAPGESYVTSSSALRQEPADPGRGKPGAKPPAPPLAVLLRGEKVVVLASRGEWSRVRASDGTEGWLKAAALLAAAGVTEATVLDPTWAFDRPDLLAVNARRKLEPGTLLLVTRTKELFSEVDGGAGPPTWVLSDRLVTRPEEVMSAKLVEKARHLARGGRPEEAREVLEVLRSRLPGSSLAHVLAVELGVAPPDDAGPGDGGLPPEPAPAPPGAGPR